VSTERDTYDVVVIGGGGAGLAAAITAASLGRSVLVLEHTDKIGGTTAISGGMVWVPANYKMLEAGLADTTQAAWQYLRTTVPGCENDPRMCAFVARGNEAVHFFDERTAVKLRPVRRYPDYYPDLPGATAGGRVLEPVPFDARSLGKDFALLRDPLAEFLLFGGMMISREDIPVFRRMGRSPRALWHVAKLVLRYARQRVHAHRGTSLVLGNALAARLLRSARDLGVEIVARASVSKLVTGDGRIAGVEATIDGRSATLCARCGVIVATGGISHFPELRRMYVPRAAGDLSATVAAGASYAGVELARAAGAAVTPPSAGLNDAKGWWVPVSRFVRRDGSAAVFPHVVTDRAKPGLIAVNKDGRRFVNEAVSYHEFVRGQLRDPERSVPAWLLCDSAFLWKYGLGRVRPFALSVRRYVESGYLKRAATIEDLAAAIGVPALALADTVRKYNAAAATGEDPEFGRGSNIYQRHLGDVEHQPNPCVAPIERAPFYAVAVYPADLGMAAGVVTDEYARVLTPDGRVIEGLYACGNDMHSIMNGAYPGPGITLGPALVFGYIAASHACQGVAN